MVIINSYMKDGLALEICILRMSQQRLRCCQSSLVLSQRMDMISPGLCVYMSCLIGSFSRHNSRRVRIMLR